MPTDRSGACIKIYWLPAVGRDHLHRQCTKPRAKATVRFLQYHDIGRQFGDYCKRAVRPANHVCPDRLLDVVASGNNMPLICWDMRCRAIVDQYRHSLRRQSFCVIVGEANTPATTSAPRQRIDSIVLFTTSPYRLVRKHTVKNNDRLADISQQRQKGMRGQR